ncbi:hypothetical protein HDV63DRAFT_383073 [Trichoderma sp. SZMC 28014]
MGSELPYREIVIRVTETTSNSGSISYPSCPRSSRTTTSTRTVQTPLAAAPERPTTPPVDVTATSSFYWELSISPPFYEPRDGEPQRGDFLSCDTYSEIPHEGLLRLSDEMTYYRVLQHFHQWRKAADICPWALGFAPSPQEVVRYGLMHRFLNSLDPPPPGWVCPPLVAQNRRRIRRRHRRLVQRNIWLNTTLI